MAIQMRTVALTDENMRIRRNGAGRAASPELTAARDLPPNSCLEFVADSDDEFNKLVDQWRGRSNTLKNEGNKRSIRTNRTTRTVYVAHIPETVTANN